MSAACAFHDTVFIAGTGGAPYNEMWKWNAATGWYRCADMMTGRGYACLAVVDSTLYVLGGKTTDITTSVERYNTVKNQWTSAGDLVHAVRNSSCVTHKNYIYVFGGQTGDKKIVNYVQVYNTENQSCTLLEKPMPQAHYAMRAVLWETSVILIDNSNCYIYNFETQIWQERKQFKTFGDYFASTLNNSSLYIAGGTCNPQDNHTVPHQTCTDEIKSVPVLDIMNNKPAVWRHHAQLPKPAMILAYGCVYVHIKR